MCRWGLVAALGVVSLVGSFSPVWADNPDVVINEVMANPLDESAGEYVELYNNGTTAVDVSGWFLMDAADTNDTIVDYTGAPNWGLSGTVIPAGGYALVVDPGYDGAYNSYLASHADPSKVLLLTISGDVTLGNGLTNGGDEITIKNGLGYSETFVWESDAGNGISWEKIDPSGGDNSSNWAPSTDPSGSTPGCRNSVTPLPYDISISSGDISFSPIAPLAGADVAISAQVHNVGLDSISGVEVAFFEDVNSDSLFDPNEQIGTAQTIAEVIAPGDSATASVIWADLAAGIHAVFAEASHSLDEDSSDNKAMSNLRVGYLPGGMVINEVMYNPSQDEPEWVEVFNRGDGSIDLKDWTIEDSDSTRPHTIASETAPISSGGYAIVAKDSSAFVQFYPEANCPVLEPEGWSFLNNDSDAVVLRDFLGNPIDRLTYSSDWGGGKGKSLERIRPDLSSADSTNWGTCRLETGATPGMKNSLSPQAHDVSILASDVRFTPEPPSAGDEVAIEAIVHNIGVEPASDIAVVFFHDVDGDTIAELGEAIDDAQVSGPLAPGDSASASVTWSAVPSGIHQVVVKADYPADEDTSNNLAIAKLRVGFQVGDIVVNEVMYDPSSEEPEWVEVYNRSDRPIDLMGWTAEDADSTSRNTIADLSVEIEPGGFAVVAADSEGLKTVYPQVHCPILHLPGFPRLNNDFDTVLIRDSAGFAIDRVDYSQDWGGGDGKSLERINPDLSSNDGDNWATCVSYDGATPGAQNSVFAPRVAAEAGIAVSPNPFDGHTIIAYQLPLTTATVTLKVYDIRGRLVRVLRDQEPSGSRGEVVWDGTDDEGKRLRMGIYILYLEALNSEKGVLETVKKTVVLAGRLN